MSDFNALHNRAVWFDIPVSDLGRAAEFYRAVLDVKVEDVEAGGYNFCVIEHTDGNGGCLVPNAKEISGSAGKAPPATRSTRPATSGRASSTRSYRSRARVTPTGATPGSRSPVRSSVASSRPSSTAPCGSTRWGCSDNPLIASTSRPSPGSLRCRAAAHPQSQG